jgi:hypothetical protein
MGNPMKRLLLLITAVVFMTGCARVVYMNNFYAGTRFSGYTVRIAIVDSINFSCYVGNTEKEFPRNRADSVKHFILESVSRAVRAGSVFGQVSLQSPECTAFQTATFPSSNQDTFRILLPTPDCDFSHDSNTVWLFLENTSVSSVPMTGDGLPLLPFSAASAIAAVTAKPLTIKSDFVYWDPVKRKPIAWGKARGEHDEGLEVTKASWEKASQQFALSTIALTPFERKTAQPDYQSNE